jgi:UDP-N-acetylmuramate dehydrogenase
MDYQQLKDFAKERNIKLTENEALSKHTYFKIGGAADIIIYPNSVDDVISIIGLCKNINFYFLGNGSNILVSDSGFKGVIIKTEKLNTVSLDENNMISAGAGALLSKASTFAYHHSLSGLEFAFGIPGSVGGAVFMNAGAYDGEMKDIVFSTTYIDEKRVIKTVLNKEHDFSYRKSIFKENKGFILSTKLLLHNGNKATIKAKMDEFKKRRIEKQPLEYPSAGSVFKRPEGHYAGKLIEDAGLKGYKIGGAMVSDKHSGFIINIGNAKCADVLALIDTITDTVYEKFNVQLECEILKLGEL